MNNDLLDELMQDTFVFKGEWRYVCGDYLRVSDAAANGGMTMDENTLKLLLSAMIQSGRPNGSGAPLP